MPPRGVRPYGHDEHREAVMKKTILGDDSIDYYCDAIKESLTRWWNANGRGMLYEELRNGMKVDVFERALAKLELQKTIYKRGSYYEIVGAFEQPDGMLHDEKPSAYACSDCDGTKPECKPCRRNTMEAAGNMCNLPVRSVSIRNKKHPEWGTWGVYEDHGDWYDIHGNGGSRVLYKTEAVAEWEIVPEDFYRKAEAASDAAFAKKLKAGPFYPYAVWPMKDGRWVVDYQTSAVGYTVGTFPTQAEAEAFAAKQGKPTKPMGASVGPSTAAAMNAAIARGDPFFKPGEDKFVFWTKGIMLPMKDGRDIIENPERLRSAPYVHWRELAANPVYEGRSKGVIRNSFRVKRQLPNKQSSLSYAAGPWAFIYTTDNSLLPEDAGTPIRYIYWKFGESKEAAQWLYSHMAADFGPHVDDIGAHCGHCGYEIEYPDAEGRPVTHVHRTYKPQAGELGHPPQGKVDRASGRNYAGACPGCGSKNTEFVVGEHPGGPGYEDLAGDTQWGRCNQCDETWSARAQKELPDNALQRIMDRTLSIVQNEAARKRKDPEELALRDMTIDRVAIAQEIGSTPGLVGSWILAKQREMGFLGKPLDTRKYFSDPNALNKGLNRWKDDKFSSIEMHKLSAIMPRAQLKLVPDLIAAKSEERLHFINTFRKLIKTFETMPKTFQARGEDAIAYLHYFSPGMDFYIVEKDMGGGEGDTAQTQAFGYAGSNGELEGGYIDIEELKRTPTVELDFYFKPARISELRRK